MENREKQKVFAQTFIPSVGVFEDKPGPIQLASKAKDCRAILACTTTMSFKHSMQARYAQTYRDQNALIADVKNQYGSSSTSSSCSAVELQEKNMNQIKSRNIAGSTETLNIAPRQLTYEERCCSPSPSVPYKGIRNTSITPGSTCPSLPDISNGKGRSTSEYTRCPNINHPCESRPKSSTSLSESKRVKETVGFCKSFQLQPSRSTMKLEKNRGHQRLPVGIAVARQRQDTIPSRLEELAKHVSPGERLREHSLDQEREVLLRENKERADMASRLLCSSSSPGGLQMLNIPNAVLPSWDREQALMTSSLLQWQAQNSLLNSGLQHPSMWFSGLHPYRIAAQQSGSELPTTPTTGFSVVGERIPGGLVIMPPAGMWSPVALYGNTRPTTRNIAQSFPALLSHQGEVPLLIDEEQLGNRSTATSYARMVDSETSSPCPHYRGKTSPYMVSTVRGVPLHEVLPCHACGSAKQSPTTVRRLHRDQDTLPQRQGCIDPHTAYQILDLSSSSENVSSTGSVLKVGMDKMYHVVHKAPETAGNITSNTPLARCRSDVLDNSWAHSCSPASTSTARDTVRGLPKYAAEDVPGLSVPHESAGVELLTRAADIHLRHLGVARSVQEVTQTVQVSGSVDTVPEPVTDCRPVLMPCQTRPLSPDKDTNTTPTSSAAGEFINRELDPEVLEAVRGITLLSHASFSRQHKTDLPKRSCMPELPVPVAGVLDLPLSSCGENDEVQSTISFSSAPEPVIFSGDGMSSGELKERDSSCERVHFRRKLKRTISSKFKSSKDEEANCGIKLGNMEAKEEDMKMRLADLQRRYREKQRELARLQKRNRNEVKHHTSSRLMSACLTPGGTTIPGASAHDLMTKSDSWSKRNSSIGDLYETPEEIQCQPATSRVPSEKHITFVDSRKLQESRRLETKCLEKHRTEKRVKKQRHRGNSILTSDKKTSSRSSAKRDVLVPSMEKDSRACLNFHQMPSGSRKRKADKPKRICIPFGERTTVPLVEAAKNTGAAFENDDMDMMKEAAGKKCKRRLKDDIRKMKHEESISSGRYNKSAISSWIFRSSNKIEKPEKKKFHAKKRMEKDKSKLQKALAGAKQKTASSDANLSNNNNNKRKRLTSYDEKILAEASSSHNKKESSAEEVKITVQNADDLQLREEDLVKGLQVLVPLEDKLLYLCQINPIQPPDIYEVTVEGERHRHRPIVMCLEQILSEAVPDVKPDNVGELCEGSRVAAYWSHKMHCLYTGTIAFGDSDCEEDELGDENLVQVEFDDGDSSMIPLEDIRLLPRNYPIMQPEAPFMVHYINRRKTSEVSTQSKDAGKTPKSKSKRKAEKKDKSNIKHPKGNKKSAKTKNGSVVYYYDYHSSKETMASSWEQCLKGDGSNAIRPAISATATETSSSVSSADEESDTVFSDSSDDTYEDDGDKQSRLLRIREKRLPSKCDRRQNLSTNELWEWHDRGIQKIVVKGKAKKIYHKSIRRGEEVISCGDSAVFLSSGRLYLPYIGRIESMWESWGDNMVVKVRWFYHPEETKGGRMKLHGKHPLYKSSHIDENDVQTISHKCEVVSFKEYTRRMRNGEQNIFYCTGVYEPATGQVVQEYSDRKKQTK